MKRIAIAIALAGVSFTATAAFAQDQESPQVTGPLGLTQNAWNDYLRNRGESKERPGYVRYVYDPQQAFPVRIREGMITTIKLPEGEEIVEAYVGDDAGFNVGLPNSKNIVVKANYPGVDTNLIAYSESGNIYTFYLRSESYSAKNISDFLVDVVAPGSKGAYNGSQMDSMSPEQRAAYDERNPAAAAARIRDPYATLPSSTDPRFREYAEWTDFDPAKVREDLGVYVPVEQTGGTIPYRVFRDDRFTYIDYGPEASQMTEWPTPLIVIQGVEGPVGNRTAGPGGRMIVIEALGDFVLRNGKRIIIVKPRSSSPDAKLVEYPTYAQTRMDIPADLPPGRAAELPAKPKTVVPDITAPVTADREHPSKVVPITNGNGTVAATANPTRTTFVNRAVVQETPVAKGGGSPVREAVAVTTEKVTDEAIVTGAALGATSPTGASVVTVPVSAPEARYYVTLGKGTRADLEDRWRSAKVQHYELLLGREPTYVEGADGTEMRVEGYQTPAAAIALCEAMTEQPTCSVRTKN